jgi:hypothetical protein
MKKLKLGILAVMFAASLPASAVVLGFQDEFSGGTNCANLVSGCSLLSAEQTATGVHFELQGTMAPGEFITGLYGNYNGGPLAISNVAGSGSASFTGYAFSPDSFKADGDGYFDWFIDLSSNPPRFDGLDTLSWDFAGATLALFNSLSVNGPTDKNGFLFATHAQGLLLGGSGWFKGQLTPTSTPFDVTPVPEPSEWALMLAGLGAIGYMAKRRKQQQQ